MEPKNPEAARQQWLAFLQEWPLERLEKLTLVEYYNADNNAGFFQWLLVHTKDIGEFNEGPLSTGVRLRTPNQPDKEFNDNVRSDSRHLWYANLGDTAEAAFNTVKNDMLTAVKAAQSGNLAATKSIKHTPGALIWKVAFLYQDPQHPCILPFYTRQQLRHVYPEGNGYGIIHCQNQLIATKGNQDILEYAARLIEEANGRADSSAVSAQAHENPPQSANAMPAAPLNQILYGPPGTGKTYRTINKALEILNPDLLKTPGISRDSLVNAFRDFVARKQIVFCTFHQSYSYEDFVEGLKAETSDGQLAYETSDGVFKRLCDDARSGPDAPLNTALNQLKAKLESEGRISMKTVRNKTFGVEYTGGDTFRIFPESTQNQQYPYRASISDVIRYYNTNDKSNIFNPSYVHGILNYLKEHFGLPDSPVSASSTQTVLPCVLIIDEINRGNVSRIFGELITLIEPSKREGAEEALSVTLPYSKNRFSVPQNVYLIGTMNTADRSLAGLDIALRRRFVFEEMPPKPDELEGIVVNGIGLKPLLEIINQRIEALLDRDHCIGHAYFMPLKNKPDEADRFNGLGSIFRNQIIPLLQEYFFEDWERIQWVLNDHRKPDPADRFIDEHPMNNTALFGDKVSLPPQARRWRINAAAFTRPEAYLGIFKTTPTVEPDAP